MKSKSFVVTLLLLCFSALFLNNSKHFSVDPIILEDGKYYNGKEFLPFAEIQILKGKITVISDKKTDAPGKRILVKGKFIIPGLIDGHVHLAGSPTFPIIRVDPLMNLNSSLRCGVTTNIDLFFFDMPTAIYKDSVKKHPPLYSTFLTSGTILTAPNGHGSEYGFYSQTISSVAEAKKITKNVAKQKNFDVIKLVYNAYTDPYFLSKEELVKIVKVAHKHHKKVFAHINISKEAMDCVDAGVDVLAHIPYDKLSNTDLEKIKKSGVTIIPTLSVFKSVLEGNDSLYMSDPLLWNSAHVDYLANTGHRSTGKLMDGKLYNLEPAYEENVANCIKMNIPLLAGTDAGNFGVFYGYTLHNELAVYCKNGFSNSEALNSATQNILRVFPSIKIGKIEVGFDADMVILNSNPLENISNTKDIDFVINKGYFAEKVEFKKSKN